MVLLLILLPSNFRVLLGNVWSAFAILLLGTLVILSPSTFVMLLSGTFRVFLDHFWSAFLILLPGTFVMLLPGTFVVLLGTF